MWLWINSSVGASGCDIDTKLAFPDMGNDIGSTCTAIFRKYGSRTLHVIGGKMKDQVKVSSEIYSGLEAVRRSGLTNMFAYKDVAHIADSMGFTEAHDWILENPRTYSEGIFAGFEPTGIEGE